MFQLGAQRTNRSLKLAGFVVMRRGNGLDRLVPRNDCRLELLAESVNCSLKLPRVVLARGPRLLNSTGTFGLRYFSALPQATYRFL